MKLDEESKNGFLANMFDSHFESTLEKRSFTRNKRNIIYHNYSLNFYFAIIHHYSFCNFSTQSTNCKLLNTNMKRR